MALSKKMREKLLRDFRNMEAELREVVDNNWKDVDLPYITMAKGERTLVKARFNRKANRFDRIEFASDAMLEEFKIPQRLFAK